MNNDIHEAIQFIILSVEKQRQDISMLKNYINCINSFHVFEQYLKDNSICMASEKICLEHMHVEWRIPVSKNCKIIYPVGSPNTAHF